jgi:hypothetical protein
MEVGDSCLPFSSPCCSFVLSRTSTSRCAERNKEASELPRVGVAVLLCTLTLRRASRELTAPVPIIVTVVPVALGGEGGGEAGVVTFGRVLD